MAKAKTKKSRTYNSPSNRSRAKTFAKRKTRTRKNHQFNYDLDFKSVDFRKQPELYRVGVGEQGVLLVEPYKSEILPHWKFKDPEAALKSAKKIFQLFKGYKRAKDFVGMDMARKFLQMGYTRSRRYANHASGRKYDSEGAILPFKNDPKKAASALIFKEYWQKAEDDAGYAKQKQQHIQSAKDLSE
jgi:hypothetical protein